MKSYLHKISLLLFITVLVISCGEDSSGPSGNDNWTDDTQSVSITWKESTVVFEGADTNDVKNYDEDFSTIVFEGSSSKASGLAVGDIIFIWGKTLRKVSSVDDSGGDIVVVTEKATLDEAVEEAKISWDKGIEFNSENVPSIIQGGKESPIPQIADDKFKAEFKVGEFDGSVEFEVMKEKANVTCELKKDLGNNIAASYKFEGNIERFRSKADMEMKNSKLQNFEYDHKGFRGDLTLTLTATATAEDLLGGFELPVVIYKVPFIVGGIPMSLNFKIVFVINTKLIGFDASSWVSAKFKYDSNLGLTYDGVDAGVSGGPVSYSMDKDKAQTGGSAPAVTANFGVGFPRVEVSMLNDVIVPYIQTGFLINGFYRTGTKPCQEAKALFQGLVGFNFELFGLKLSGSKVIWENEKILLQSGDCE